jgi:hypothetical protein
VAAGWRASPPGAPRRRSGGEGVGPGGAQRAVEPARLGADEVELLVGRASVGREGRHASGALPLEAADALAEEGVEVARGDAEEAQTLEEGRARVAGHVQDARVEVEPA